MPPGSVPGAVEDLDAPVNHLAASTGMPALWFCSPGFYEYHAAYPDDRWELIRGTRLGHTRAKVPCRISPNDMKGLVGEIVAEEVLVECGYGGPFYSKRRHGGTRTSKGVDIILRKGCTLSANESKHLHAMRPGSDTSRDISAAITAAFRQNDDRHTMRWLKLLRLQCDRADLLSGAMHAPPPGTGSLHRMAEILDKALSGQSVPLNAVAVFDAQHSADAGSIRDRLGPDTLRGTTAAVAAAVDGLHKATASLIRGHC